MLIWSLRKRCYTLCSSVQLFSARARDRMGHLWAAFAAAHSCPTQNVEV